MKTTLNLVLIFIRASCAGAVLSQTPPQADSSDVRIVSSLVADGAPVPDECREEAHAFAQSLFVTPGLPPGTGCWFAMRRGSGVFLRLSSRDEQAEIYASTDLSGRTTYIRGAKLLYPYDLQAEPDDIIAHELAHIRLQSSSEARADSLARRWQSSVKQGLR